MDADKIILRFDFILYSLILGSIFIQIYILKKIFEIYLMRCQTQILVLFRILRFTDHPLHYVHETNPCLP